MINLEEATPKGDDILLIRVPKSVIAGGKDSFTANLLGTEDNGIEDDPLQFFFVVAAGPKVKDIAAGNVIACQWTHITPPLEALYNGKRVKFGVTDESQVLAIIEGAENEV